MRRHLIVAHRTLGGAHLMDHVHELRVTDPYCRFHVIVPVQHPSGHVWSDGEVKAKARTALEEMLERLASVGVGASGEVGDVNPVYAVGTALRREGRDAFAGVIVSTLPKEASRWWPARVPERIERVHGLPVTHLVAEEALVG